MLPKTSGRGFIVFSKTALPRHELDEVLPVSGSSVASINRVKSIIKTHAFPGDDEGDKNTMDEISRHSETEFDCEEEKDERSGTKSKSSFASLVEYLFSFSEVAFLLWKLYQCANRRYDIRQKSIMLGTNKNAEDDNDENEDERKERKRLLLKLNIEKLSSIQKHQLTFIAALRNTNKRRWVSLKNKVVEYNKRMRTINRDKDFLLMGLAYSSNMREFMENEVNELFNDHGQKWKKQMESKKLHEIKLDTTPREEINDKEDSAREDDNKYEVHERILESKQQKKKTKYAKANVSLVTTPS